jgi:hypothetical protein
MKDKNKYIKFIIIGVAVTAVTADNVKKYEVYVQMFVL